MYLVKLCSFEVLLRDLLHCFNYWGIHYKTKHIIYEGHYINITESERHNVCFPKVRIIESYN